MNNVNLILIGAGCLGASVFRSLKKLGVKNILVIDGDQIGSGASAKSGGMSRVYHLNAKDRQAAFYSQKKFNEMEKELGLEISRTGSLSILDRETADKDSLKGFQVLEKKELEEKFSEFHFYENEIGVFEEEGCSISPTQYSQLIFDHYADNTDFIMENVFVQSIKSHYLEKRHEVICANKTFTAPIVVLATGVGSKNLLPDVLDDEVIRKKYISTFELEVNEEKEFLNFFDYKNITYGTCVYGGKKGHMKVGTRSGKAPSRKKLNKYFGDRFNFPFTIKENFESIADLYTEDRQGILGEVCGRKGLFVIGGWGGGAFKFSPYLGKKLGTTIFEKYYQVEEDHVHKE